MNSPTVPEFPRHDPATPAFWDARFEADFTPWEQAGVPHCLADYVGRFPEPKRVLIPGCGSAHEARLFLKMKWPVDAIDFSPAAVARAKATLGPLGVSVREADFFGPDLASDQFDVIYERAFLCALPATLREAWATRIAMLLPRDGSLIGFFYFDDSRKGPPFSIDKNALLKLLEKNFDLSEEREPSDSIPIFAGKERWQVWRRR